MSYDQWKTRSPDDDLGSNPKYDDAEPEPMEKRPVAWRVRDYADGWLIFQDERAAYAYANAVGAEMQGLYIRNGQ